MIIKICDDKSYVLLQMTENLLGFLSLIFWLGELFEWLSILLHSVDVRQTMSPIMGSYLCCEAS